MKLLKSLSVGLLAIAAVSTASAAPTIIHVAGSTAFRTATSIAIIDALQGNKADGTVGSTQVFAALDTAGKNITNSNSQIFANGTIGGSGTATIIVEATWTGSVAGVVDLVAGASQAKFIDETNATVISTVNGSPVTAGTDLIPASGNGLIPGTVAYRTTSNTVELAMSDSLKGTVAKEVATATLTGSVGSFSTIASLATATGGSNVVDAGTIDFAAANGDVAIVPFEWVVQNITTPSYTPPANITQEQARQLISSGSEPQGLFTGLNNAADTANYFYLTGRNEDSGTRIGAFSETQFGVTSAPVQWQLGDGGGTATTPIQKFPANTALNTETAISWAPAGHSGFTSGGNVANTLGLANNGSTLSFSGKPSGNTGASYFIGYVGLTDAATAIGKGAKALSYNGVPFSETAVINGSYSFWTYEHAYRLSTTSGTTTGNFIDTVADLIFAADADATYGSGGVGHAFNSTTNTYAGGEAGLFDFLNVSRSKTEGLPITY